MSTQPQWDRPVELLLVEDSPIDTRMVEECFNRIETPNHISAVDNGKKALVFLRRGVEYADAPRPDIILLDLNLPKLSGFEVLAAVKKAPDLKSIPVLVLSTTDNEKDINRAYQMQACCYLTKPRDVDGFVDLVNSIEDFWFGRVKLPVQAPAGSRSHD